MFFLLEELESTPKFSALDNLKIQDYVHKPLNFTLNIKKFSEIAEMSVQMHFNDDSTELQMLADALLQPSNFVNEIELCWMQVTEDEVSSTFYISDAYRINGSRMKRNT